MTGRLGFDDEPLSLLGFEAEEVDVAAGALPVDDHGNKHHLPLVGRAVVFLLRHAGERIDRERGWCADALVVEDAHEEKADRRLGRCRHLEAHLGGVRLGVGQAFDCRFKWQEESAIPGNDVPLRFAVDHDEKPLVFINGGRRLGLHRPNPTPLSIDVAKRPV
jgi:hypothetical protein